MKNRHAIVHTYEMGGYGGSMPTLGSGQLAADAVFWSSTSGWMLPRRIGTAESSSLTNRTFARASSADPSTRTGQREA